MINVRYIHLTGTVCKILRNGGELMVDTAGREKERDKRRERRENREARKMKINRAIFIRAIFTESYLNKISILSRLYYLLFRVPC